VTAIERKKIALVEDAADTTEWMTLFLNNLCDDFELHAFSTGAAFLDEFRTGVYRAVLRAEPTTQTADKRVTSSR
jgi:hypothetical protein